MDTEDRFINIIRRLQALEAHKSNPSVSFRCEKARAALHRAGKAFRREEREQAWRFMGDVEQQIVIGERFVAEAEE